jgi:hypothetical protein
MDERARPSATREAVSRRGRLSRSATRDGGALRTERTERGDERRLSLRSHAAEDLPGGRRPLRDLQLIGVSGIPIPDDQWSGLAFATGLVDIVPLAGRSLLAGAAYSAPTSGTNLKAARTRPPNLSEVAWSRSFSSVRSQPLDQRRGSAGLRVTEVVANIHDLFQPVPRSC